MRRYGVVLRDVECFGGEHYVNRTKRLGKKIQFVMVHRKHKQKDRPDAYICRLYAVCDGIDNHHKQKYRDKVKPRNERIANVAEKFDLQRHLHNQQCTGCERGKERCLGKFYVKLGQ